MANVISLTGSDTVTIAGRVLADFATTDIATLTFPNELANLKTGKNGNTIYAENTTGRQADFVLRLIMGSSDDIFMQGKFAQQMNDFSKFTLLSGSFVKHVGNGTGGVGDISYSLIGGIFTKGVEAKTNIEGDVEQSIAIWTMRFSSSNRAILAPAAT